MKNTYGGNQRWLRIGGRIASASLLLSIIAGRTADSSIQAFHRAYGPKSALLVSSPTLQWEVWPSDGARVTSASMVINGEKVDASYNQSSRRLEYRPTNPFRAGKYDVKCRVMVEGRLEVKKDWTFQVSNDAISRLPGPDTTQDTGLEETNRYRKALGLEEAYQEDRLNAASLAHVKYLAKNRRTGHYEKEGEPGFVGVTPAQRLEAFGYSGGSWECVTYNSGGIKESVRDLFHAPYHRIPFLQPGRVPVGTGIVGTHFAIKFGDSGGAGLTVSPASGQTGVPTSWDGNEHPNPLRMHSPGNGDVGYPIVFSYFGEDYPVLKLVEASLTCNGKSIPVFENSSLNDDHLENSIIVMPKKPLAANETYDVWIKASVNGKGNIEKRWSFTTGSK